jgi:hypothetical protein
MVAAAYAGLPNENTEALVRLLAVQRTVKEFFFFFRDYSVFISE